VNLVKVSDVETSAEGNESTEANDDLCHLIKS
jgi:hypothetical protein